MIFRPDLADTDRALLADILRDLSWSMVDQRTPEQLLHGEQYPWNILDTENGLLFIDFENTRSWACRVRPCMGTRSGQRALPGIDRDLFDHCRGVVLAIIATHRWRHDDQHPSGRRSGVWRSSTSCATVRRGRRSTVSSGDAHGFPV